ncbi:MAG: Na+/H+ antiporter [Candidatus Thermoplasmatota archaeon]
MEIAQFLIILIIASIVAVLAKHIRWPYTIALLISGIIVGLLGGYFNFYAPVTLDKEIIFHILLPPLLFEGALHMPLRHLRENAKTISLLAIPGVILSTIFVGFIINLLIPEIPLYITLLFAAIIIPTDPASVLAIYKETKVPQKMRTIVEGESIFDDGIAIVMYNVLVGLIVVGDLDLAQGALQFARLSIIGIALGAAFGYITFHILRKIDDRFTEVMITMILAFGIFSLAEVLGGSGVFAVVIAGLILGNYGTRFAMTPSTRVSLVSFWGFLAFAVNSLLFILVGMSVPLGALGGEVLIILIAVLALWCARALTVTSVGRIINKRKKELPGKWQVMMWWGGLRGAIPIALALSIPLGFPHRDTILTATFGVVLFTLLVQGLTLKPMLRLLGFQAERKEDTEEAFVKDTVSELKEMHEDGELSGAGYEWLTHRFSQANSQLLTDVGALIHEHGFLPREEYAEAVRETLRSKCEMVKDALGKGLITPEAGRRLIDEIELQTAVLPRDISTAKPLPGPTALFRTVTRWSPMERKCWACHRPVEKEEEGYVCRCGTHFHRECLEGVEKCPVCMAKV